MTDIMSESEFAQAIAVLHSFDMVNPDQTQSTTQNVAQVSG